MLRELDFYFRLSIAVVELFEIPEQIFELIFVAYSINFR